MIRISPMLVIPEAEIEERFVRASGPGGQNVNKVATAVELRFDVANSAALPSALKERLLARRDRRLSAEGVIVINAQRFRSQERNREDARLRLTKIIQAVLTPPRARIATQPSRAVKERRLTNKRVRAQVKRARTARSWEHDT